MNGYERLRRAVLGRRTLILTGMRRRPLPDGLRTYRATEKMVWMYIALNGEDEYSARLLSEELGSVKNVMASALTRLRDTGWLLEVKPPLGNRSGIYKTADPDKLANIKMSKTPF